METRNQTAVSEFLVLGLTDDPALQRIIFTLFLSMYLVTVLGNLLNILTVSSYSHLRTPMYFLLSNLSFSDMCFSTTTIPKMLVNIQRQSKTIGYTGCLRQIGFVLIFTALESTLLAVMAYDHYVAICCPLRYFVIMNPHFCVLLILLSLSISIVDGLLHSLMMKETVFLREFPVRIPAASVTREAFLHVVGELVQPWMELILGALISRSGLGSNTSISDKCPGDATTAVDQGIVCITVESSLLYTGFLSTIKPRNRVMVSEFLLLGLTENPNLQSLLFSLFLSMYLVTILGNLLIILAFISDSHPAVSV
ncbi:olfactory receptor 7E24-like [Sciurus carolinensis]|uniref:olfactory receptor 7E24-like n=1 Tax=Sciurus carolinensis TaxID=30640 RepID=UPI001FB3A9F8|nr:olfactory receptor 7E24-like [Sciurus carolinensis]